MTIIEFCKKYKEMNSDKVKEQMLQAHIKRTYCPIVEKITILQIMLDKSIKVSESGLKYVDMVISRINYTLAMVALYTDLKIDSDENGKGMNLDDYDALVENGLIIEICNIIGNVELSEFNTVNSTLIQNFEKSEGSLEAYISRTVNDVSERIMNFIDVVLNPEQVGRILEQWKQIGVDLNV